jgi:hypothetical protein
MCFERERDGEKEGMEGKRLFVDTLESHFFGLQQCELAVLSLTHNNHDRFVNLNNLNNLDQLSDGWFCSTTTRRKSAWSSGTLRFGPTP